MKNAILSGLAGIVIGASALYSGNNPSIQQSTSTQLTSQPTTQAKRISYKIEDLCDTPVKRRDLNVEVYFSRSRDKWERDYGAEIFGYVQEAFMQAKVRCKVELSKEPFDKKRKEASKMRVEIYRYRDQFVERYRTLRELPESFSVVLGKQFANEGGIALTDYSLALVCLEWTNFSRELQAVPIDRRFDFAGGKDFVLKTTAKCITHELGHLAGLVHPLDFFPHFEHYFLDEENNVIPYVMTKRRDMEFLNNPTKHCSLGHKFSKMETEMLHSFLAGGMTYKVSSSKTIGQYHLGLAEDNDRLNVNFINRVD